MEVEEGARWHTPAGNARYLSVKVFETDLTPDEQALATGKRYMALRRRAALLLATSMLHEGVYSREAYDARVEEVRGWS